MRELTSVWHNLEPRRRVIVVLATLAMFAAVIGLARMASSPTMALLYAGLDETRAGEVLAALDQNSAVYEVRGSAIYVDAKNRDALRMTLAAEGLPSNSGAGYELLDSLSGFGTTSQMFDAAYLRAKEGELARTIMALPGVRLARVHIAEGRAGGLRAQPNPTASVTVATTTGTVSPDHARALKFLVASAVAGMSPEDVSVIDGRGALVDSGDETTGAAASDRAEALRANVERLLEARVGAGNAVVEVSVDTVNERESITERTFDPDSRVAISTDTEEKSSSSTDSGGDAVTVASNLPTGAAGGQGSNSQSQGNETRERTNYEVSEKTRELVKDPGSIRRLTVAVLVNATTTVGADGAETVAPRSEEELTALHDLVAAVVGFQADRGDVITVKSLAFEPLADAGTAPAVPLVDRLGLDIMTLLQLAVLAVVSLVLGLFVVRPILASRNARLPAAPQPRALGVTPSGEALTGVIDDGDAVPENLAVVSGKAGQAGELSADPVDRLRRMIADRQSETVEILRGWMEEPGEERAR